MSKRKLQIETSWDGTAWKKGLGGVGKGLGGAGKDVDKFSKKIVGSNARVTKSFTSMAKKGGAAAAGMVTAYASIAGAKKAITATETLAKATLTLNKSFGLSVKTASQWAAVSQVRGADGAKLTMGFKALATQARNAAAGSKTQIAAFKELGVTQDELKAKGDDLQWLLGQVSDGLGKMPTGTNKAAVSARLFGRTWTTIAPLIRGGSDEMKANLALADKYGATFSGKGVKSVEDFIKAQREAKLATLGLQVAFGTQMAPMLTKGINAFAGFVAQVRAGKGAGGAFASAFNGVKTTIQTAASAIGGFIKRNRSDLAAIGKALADVGKVFVAVFRRAAPAVKAGLGGIVGIVKGVVKVVGGVLRGDFGAVFSGLKGIVSGGMKLALNSIRAFTAPLREIASRAAGGIASAFRGAVNKVKGAALGIVRGIQGVARKLPGWFLELGKDIVRGIINGVGAMAGALKDKITGMAGDVAGWFGDKLDIGSPSRVFHTIGEQIVQGLANGLVGSKAILNAGLKSGLLFPIEAAIAELQAERERLEGSFARWDRRRERGGLLAAIRTARRGELVTVGSDPASSGGGVSSSGGSSSRSGGRSFGSIVELGRALQRQGFTVGEHPKFGGVGRHTKGSHHYAGNALDINADNMPGGEAKNLDRLYKQLKGMPGVVELLWKVKGHFDHLHVAFKPAAKAAKAAVANFAKAQGASVGKKRGTLKPNEIRGLAYAAGFRGQALDTMVAIVMAESGGKVRASNRNSDGTIDRGLAQINSVHGKRSTFDPAANLRAAFAISKGGRDFDPWVAFQRGLHRRHMGNVGRGSGAEVSDVGSYRTRKVDRNAVRDAVQALKEFNREGARAAKMAAMDLKQAGLERLRDYTAAITDLQTQMKDAAATAATTFRQGLEKSIDAALAAKLAAVKASPQAAELARLLGDQTADSIAREDRDQARAVRDAEQALADLRDPRGEFMRRMNRLRNAKSPAAQREFRDMVQQEKDAQQAVEDAKTAIRDTARSRRVDQLQQGITDMENAAQSEADVARASLDQQEADHKAALGRQLVGLVDNLESRKLTYAQYVQQVRAILGPYGQDFQGSAESQQALAQNVPLMNALNQMKVTSKGVYRMGASGKWIKIQNADGSPVRATGRAIGGRLRPGVVYRTGELGPEDIHMGPDGKLRVSPASQSGGGAAGGGFNVTFTGPVNLGSKQAAESYAHKTAWRIAHLGV